VFAACYTYAHGTPGVGRCRSGLQCSRDVDAGCSGDVGPIAEACNGIDDDCNGAIDDACGCAYVAPGGTDSNPGTAGLPKRRISAGIEAAADAGIARVCVAAGSQCPSRAIYGPLYSDAGEALVMRDGVSVYGQYETTGWSRDRRCSTVYFSQADAGVRFDSSVVSPTVLDGLEIWGSNLEPVSVAVRIDGSRGAVLSDVTIESLHLPDASIGVEVTGGATPTIRNCTIHPGTGSRTSIGILSRGSAPRIVDNCGTFDDGGRCLDTAQSARIRGGSAVGGVITPEVMGVLLESSPGAVIESSSVVGMLYGSGAPVAVAVRGDAGGVEIRRSSVYGSANSQGFSVGVDMTSCALSSPVIEDNAHITGASNSIFGGVAIRSRSGCGPRIVRNAEVRGCTSPLQSGQPCVGIECVGGLCEIAENAKVVAGPGTAGIRLDHATARVRRNTMVDQGYACEVGIESIESTARIENNLIRVFHPAPVGVRIVNGSSGAEVDLHSNTIVAIASNSPPCFGAAVAFETLDAGVDAGAAGVLRNNVFAISGACSSNAPVIERSVDADPRIFEHNVLSPAAPSNVLYRDEDAFDLTDAGALGAGNLGGDPGLTNALHLSAGSICRNAGTDAGAPPLDVDGDSRPAEGVFDIGADEYVP